MSSSSVDPAVVLEFKRDFLCWRGREFEERYECRVAGNDGRGASIEFEFEGIDVDAEVAADIAFCLSEALAMTEQADVESATAALRYEGMLKRKYRLSRGAWQFSATGVLPVENASTELLEGTQSAGTFVAVRTIEEGGFELEFEDMGYSFSARDALWLQEKLLEVIQQPPKQHPRVRLLEAGYGA
jgi:hypothetical protein